jgi:hypothetical protein
MESGRNFIDASSRFQSVLPYYQTHPPAGRVPNTMQSPTWNPFFEQVGPGGSGYNGQYMASSDFASNEGTYGYRGSYNAARESRVPDSRRSQVQNWACVHSHCHFPLCSRSDTLRSPVNAECRLRFNTVLIAQCQSPVHTRHRDILVPNRCAEPGIA